MTECVRVGARRLLRARAAHEPLTPLHHNTLGSGWPGMARRGEEALVVALAALVWAAVTPPAVAGPLQEAQWQQAQAQAAQRARLLRSEEHLPSEARASPRSAPRASLLRPGAREIGHTRALRAVEVPRLANGGDRASVNAA